jgi:hypothetical protein
VSPSHVLQEKGEWIPPLQHGRELPVEPGMLHAVRFRNRALKRLFLKVYLRQNVAIMKQTLTILLKEHLRSQAEVLKQQQERQERFEKEVREALVRLEAKRDLEQKTPRGGQAISVNMLRCRMERENLCFVTSDDVKGEAASGSNREGEEYRSGAQGRSSP